MITFEDLDLNSGISECHSDDEELKKAVSNLLNNMDGRDIGIVKKMFDDAWDAAVQDAYDAMSQTADDC